MGRILLGMSAVALLFAVAQALQCYKCAGLTSFCPSISATCSAGQQCYTGIGTAASFIKVKVKGCLSPDQCNMTSKVDIFGNSSLYEITKTCCTTDLCNGAPGMARLAPLSLTLVTLVGAFITKALV